MTECEYGRQFSAYHDGELSGAARAELEQHLARCAACAAELNRLGALSRMLAGAARPAVPPAALRRWKRSVDVIAAVEIARMAGVVAAIAASILLLCSLQLLRTGSAGGPKDTIPVWETVAVVSQGPAPAAPEEQLAQWIVQDLSGNSGHEQD